jgi:anaerobic selenocysteine-containing dehydrogenase
MKVGVCLGGNLLGASPDTGFAAAALAKLDLVVYLNTTLNTGHAHGLAKETIVLPVLARDEEPEPTTQESMFNFVRLSDGGPPRHDGPRSEAAVVAELARRVLGTGGPIDWPQMAHASRIRQAIAHIVPGLAPLADIVQTRREFHIEGRVLHEPQFPTADGRAKLSVHELPDLAGGEKQLRLMTVRSEGQFNTVVYEEYDLYRGQDRRDVILVHPDDIARLGLKAEQRVTVRSGCGSLGAILVRPFPQIKPGNALMYYPEANVLVPRAIDPASRTPAFKNVIVWLEARTHSAAPAAPPIPELQAGASTRDQMRAC